MNVKTLEEDTGSMDDDVGAVDSVEVFGEDVGDVLALLDLAEAEEAAGIDEAAGIEDAVAAGAGVLAKKGFQQIPGLGAIPGLDSIAESLATTGVKAAGNFFSSLFKRKKKPARKVRRKPAPPRAAAVLRSARRNPQSPFHAADAILLANPRFNIEQAFRMGRMPSQVAQRPNFGARLAQAQKAQGALLARGFGNMGLAQRAAIGAASATGHMPAVLEGLRRLELALGGGRGEPSGQSGPPPASVAPSFQPAQAAASVLGTLFGTDTAGPAPTVAEVGGVEVASVPAYPHLARWSMPYRFHVDLLHRVPAVRELPLSTREMLAGEGPRASDTSGLSAADGSVFARPGETPGDLAERLTGDRSRFVELAAANPLGPTNGTEWKIPPNWMAFQRLAEDTGAPTLSTRRTYTVKSGDSPSLIAQRGGAMKVDTLWWSNLKAANPHKATKDNGANWASLYPNEVIGIPDAWPESSMYQTVAAGSGGQSPAPSSGLLRTYTVKSGDSPSLIAKNSGAMAADALWWSNLKTANPHKATKDNGANWASLHADEVINIPPNWPPSAMFQGGGAPPGWPSNLPWPPSQPRPSQPSQPQPSQPSANGAPPGWPADLPWPPTWQPSQPQPSQPQPSQPSQPQPSQPSANGAPPGWPANWPWPPLQPSQPQPSQPSQPQPSQPSANGAPPGWPANWPWPPLQPSQPQPSQPSANGAPPGWPANWPWPPLQPSQPQPSQPQPSQPSAQSVEHGVVHQAQGILAFWGRMHSKDGGDLVPDYGATVTEFSGVMTPRTEQQLRAWQKWWNRNAGGFFQVSQSYELAVPETGQLDARTWTFLKLYAEKVAPREVPAGTTPILKPEPPASPYSVPWQMGGSGGSSGESVPSGGASGGDVATKSADTPLVVGGVLALAQFSGLLGRVF